MAFRGAARNAPSKNLINSSSDEGEKVETEDSLIKILPFSKWWEKGFRFDGGKMKRGWMVKEKRKHLVSPIN